MRQVSEQASGRTVQAVVEAAALTGLVGSGMATLSSALANVASISAADRSAAAASPSRRCRCAASSHERSTMNCALASPPSASSAPAWESQRAIRTRPRYASPRMSAGGLREHALHRRVARSFGGKPLRFPLLS